MAKCKALTKSAVKGLIDRLTQGSMDAMEAIQRVVSA